MSPAPRARSWRWARRDFWWAQVRDRWRRSKWRRRDASGCRRPTSSGAFGRGSVSGSPDARAVALEVIRRVTENRAYSTLAVAGALERSGLSGRDRDLAVE